MQGKRADQHGSVDSATAGNSPEAAESRRQQHTGNHPPERVPSADERSGTRAGAENVEATEHAGSKPGRADKVDEAAQRKSAQQRAGDKGYD